MNSRKNLLFSIFFKKYWNGFSGINLKKCTVPVSFTDNIYMRFIFYLILEKWFSPCSQNWSAQRKLLMVAHYTVHSVMILYIHWCGVKESSVLLLSEKYYQKIGQLIEEAGLKLYKWKFLTLSYETWCNKLNRQQFWIPDTVNGAQLCSKNQRAARAVGLWANVLKYWKLNV